MPVNLIAPMAQSLLEIKGIKLGSTAAEIRKKGRDDVCVILIEGEATVTGGVFTKNRCAAAPVDVCRANLAKTHTIRALLINSGCANAATGEGGYKDALESCQAVAKTIGCAPHEVLPFSTGVILERLPMARLMAGIPHAIKNAQANTSDNAQEAWLAAAKAIMTTDTIAKAYSVSERIPYDKHNATWRVTGIAKGAGMIHPNMATMLGFIATDAKIDPAIMPILVKEVADASFNAITIDGDTSTNDSMILMATGKSGPLIRDTASHDYAALKAALLKVAMPLAQAIVRDGEGATKFITIRVESAKTIEEAQQVAEKIALSPLVKTAFFASDPNLGRILAAIGNAGVNDLLMSGVSLKIGELLVAENGGRAASYNKEAEKIADTIMKKEEINITVGLGRGNAVGVKMTCDYSYDYIKINAEYRT